MKHKGIAQLIGARRNLRVPGQKIRRVHHKRSPDSRTQTIAMLQNLCNRNTRGSILRRFQNHQSHSAGQMPGIHNAYVFKYFCRFHCFSVSVGRNPLCQRNMNDMLGFGQLSGKKQVFTLSWLKWGIQNFWRIYKSISVHNTITHNIYIFQSGNRL